MVELPVISAQMGSPVSAPSAKHHDMTPAARLQGSIELLAEVLNTPRPADGTIAAWFRARRYIGAKDRHAVAEVVYGVLRHYARLQWHLRNQDRNPNARMLVICHALLVEQQPMDAIAGLFNGIKFGPEPLEDRERRALNRIALLPLNHDDMPDAVQVECPPDAEDALRARFGDDFIRQLDAMTSPATLDLRVNTLKMERDQAKLELQKTGLAPIETPLSPLGLRLMKRTPVSQLTLFTDGTIEVQDEGSQMIGLMVEAEPGMTVLDMCAGAGGKTLAIGAAMKNKGRIFACDTLEGRLKRSRDRFVRAGLDTVVIQPISGETDPWLKRHRDRFDRVLVDAPCSGTGTWRRNPDSRWRQLGPAVEELVQTQSRLLDSAARLVKPGGRLIYATCSLLPAENDDQVTAFLSRHSNFTHLPIAPIWQRIVGGECPLPGPSMSLTPADHGCDGFFAAVLQRSV